MRNAVGPILRMSEDIDAVVVAIREDNPDTDVEVVDRGAYVRVHATGKLVVTEATLRKHLAPDFEIRSLQGMLSSFAGRIHTFSDRVEWETVSHD
jgi:toluene monooxygenase system protein D